MKNTSQHLIAEVPRRHPLVVMTIGIDLGDVWSHYCKLNHTNGSIDSPLEPQPAPSLHQDSSSRVRIETRWRATCGATKPRTKTKAL
jgi:hypothetical protein